MAKKKNKIEFNLKIAGKVIDEQVGKLVENAARNASLTPEAQESAFIDYYMLIDFGFTPAQPFQPNSIQFYSNETGFLCFKVVNNTSLTSLKPILDCKRIKVTWNTATKEAVFVCGIQPK